MLFVVRGFIRRYLNELGKYNISPHDISSIVFKYFENDYDRYFENRELAIMVLAEIINENEQDIVEDISNHGVTSLLRSLLQFDDVCKLYKKPKHSANCCILVSILESPFN